MKKYNCIIVDDQDVDRLMVVSYAKRLPNLNIVGIYKSGTDALLGIDNQKVDIAFLDIDMPDTDGLELRKKTLHIPVCIYITGHGEHAIESFELEALDYIIKPIKFDRFEKAVQRAVHFLEIKEKAALFELSFGDDVVYIKKGGEQTKINLYDILYLEALKDYTLLVTQNNKHCVYSNLGSILKQKSFGSFIRIHKSFAIQKQFIKKTSTHELEMNNSCLLPIGRSFKENLSF